MSEERMTLTVEETGKLLGVSRQTAYDLSRSEGFPVLRIGRRVLIPRKQLEDWIEKHMEGCAVVQ